MGKYNRIIKEKKLLSADLQGKSRWNSGEKSREGNN